MPGPTRLSGLGPLTMIVGSLVAACGDGNVAETNSSDLAGLYSATFAYSAAAGEPWRIHDARSCTAEIRVTEAADGKFAGEFAIVDDACVLEPESGTFDGFVDGDRLSSVLGLYTTVVQFDRVDCVIAEGSPLMSGERTAEGFTLAASATFSCIVPNFSPVPVATELSITAISQ